jgi:hypothetical protein
MDQVSANFVDQPPALCRSERTQTNSGRRLEPLDTRAKEVAAGRPKPHTLCFIEPVNIRVTSMFKMATGKWTHFDPPRDRAEFGPIFANGYNRFRAGHTFFGKGQEQREFPR